MEQYRNVTSYQQLLDLNCDFIEGRINWTPYHQQPFNTGPLKDELIKTNQIGFLTLGGQCSEDTPTSEKKLFLDGYFDPREIKKFIKYLKKFKKIEYFIELPNKEIKTNIRNWHLNENGVYYNSLARFKQGHTWKDNIILKLQDLSYITQNYWKSFDNIITILEKYAFVHIQHRSFHNHDNDLYQIVNGYKKSTSFGKRGKRFKKHLTLQQINKDIKYLLKNLKK